MPEQHARTNALSAATQAVPLLIVVAFVGLIPVFVGVPSPPAQAQSNRQAVQPDIIGAKCLQCHRPVVETFALDPHGKSAKFLEDSRAAACESCHGDGTKHIKTTEAADIINPAKLTIGQANESCLQCHSRDYHLFNWRGGQHERKDVNCLSCHSAHHAKSPERMLTSLTLEEGCFRCHKAQRRAMLQRSTHLFRTESGRLKVDCASCHNPHGGEGRKMLQARTVNETCFQCHAEKRGPFLWEHAPVQESCLTCHTPHGSNHASLLSKRSHQSCQQCHINIIGRHLTVAGFDVFTFNRGCVNCHTQIHGSNHPSGRTFTR